MSTYATRTVGSSVPAAEVLREILLEIAVPKPVLDEAKKRRNLVLEIAMEHEAARTPYVAGSVAHGTHNKPLEDTDCGVKMNRRYEAFRSFGPDAVGHGKGPEEFIHMFTGFLGPRLKARGYPEANINLDGNRAIKVEFNEQVDIDDWGPVDPYVDFIVALARAHGGLWIPDRENDWWDAADPEHHTWLMTERDPKALRVHRAHLLRLGKRAVKGDAIIPGRRQVMCSWNLSALSLDLVEETGSLAEGLAEFFAGAADEIRHGLTEDPSTAVEDPIALPDGVTREMAAARLTEMSAIVSAAIAARSPAGARRELEALFGDEIAEIRSRDNKRLRSAYGSRDGAAVASVLGVPGSHKITNSDGA